MKKKLNSTLTNHLTIEIQNNCIVQIAGKRNCLPSESDKKIMYEWAKKAKFVYMKEKFN
jgi:5-formaminoimidazole-4-carboxamide-1-beta-D-ribofuranosyl 5'-monophosphate synthetase